MDRHIKAPLDREEVKTLEAGDYVYITGTVYTARDAAHLRMDQALDRGEKLPIELEGNVIYYMGPTPARKRTCQLVRQVLQLQAVWINMHHVY